MRERLANGVKHEAMLRSSFKGLSASEALLRNRGERRESRGRRRSSGGVGRRDRTVRFLLNYKIYRRAVAIDF